MKQQDLEFQMQLQQGKSGGLQKTSRVNHITNQKKLKHRIEGLEKLRECITVYCLVLDNLKIR